MASSKALTKLLEREVQAIRGAILNVCRHIVSAKGWGPAETYRDYVEAMANNRAVPRGLAHQLGKFIAWRSLIVHRYLEIDHRKLYRDAKELVKVAGEFERRVAAFLRKAEA